MASIASALKATIRKCKQFRTTAHVTAWRHSESRTSSLTSTIYSFEDGSQLFIPKVFGSMELIRVYEPKVKVEHFG